VASVEHAGDTDQKEVRTHEVPQMKFPASIWTKECY
jgi:hypothetical protein